MMEDMIFLVLQFVLEVFGDLLLQAFFEGIFELIGHIRDTSRWTGIPWWASLLGYIFIGGLSGLASVSLLPHIFIHQFAWRMAALVIIPFILGVFFSWIGNMRERFGQNRTKLDCFMYAYSFAVSMAIVRYWLVG